MIIIALGFLSNESNVLELHAERKRKTSLVGIRSHTQKQALEPSAESLMVHEIGKLRLHVKKVSRGNLHLPPMVTLIHTSFRRVLQVAAVVCVLPGGMHDDYFGSGSSTELALI